MGPMAKVEFYDGRMNIHSHFSGHQWAMGDFGHFVLRNVEHYDQKKHIYIFRIHRWRFYYKNHTIKIIFTCFGLTEDLY